MLLFLFSFLAAAVFILFSMSFQYLVIDDLEQAGSRLLLPVREEEEFTIKYIHSVDLLPVYEIYECKEGNIRLKETHFYNFGAGMGLLKERGIYVEEGDLLKILEINEVIDPFILRVGEVPDQKLTHRNNEYSLVEKFGHGARVSFQIKKLSGFEILTAVIFAD